MNFLLIFPIVDFFFSSVDLNVVCCDPVLDEVVPVVKQREKMKKEEEIYDEFLICHQQYTHRSRKERRKKKKSSKFKNSTCTINPLSLSPSFARAADI